MHISYYIKKNINILQIYLYIGFRRFQIKFDNIYTLLIIL